MKRRLVVCLAVGGFACAGAPTDEGPSKTSPTAPSGPALAVDAGVEVADAASAPVVDAGGVVADAGVGPVDAATPVVDAAPAAPIPSADDPCSYRTYAWHTQKKKGVGHRLVEKTRGELTEEERDPDAPRCTVCRQDQVKIEVEGVPPVTVCSVYAEQVRAALSAAKRAGFEIRTLKGYRVGRTRGAVRDHKRTQFSNHSYGTAIDINARQNGLYRRCRLAEAPTSAADLKRCKLGVGGRWDPEARPRTTIIKGGPVYDAFTKFWRWGGEIDSQIKDFMHFSVTGE